MAFYNFCLLTGLSHENYVAFVAIHHCNLSLQAFSAKKLVPVLGRFVLCTLYFVRGLYGKIGVGFRCEHCSFQVWVQWFCVLWNSYVWHTVRKKIFCVYLPFQVRCTPNSILWRNPALSKANVGLMLVILNAIYRLTL